MAVTHADLEPNRRKRYLSSKTGTFFMVLAILLGLFCFILCLIAEATRSKVTSWSNITENKEGSKSECAYSGSGKMPLLCAACAVIGLAIVMVVVHACMLIVVSKLTPDLLILDPDSASVKSLTWQAGFFFVTTWVCFAVGEILLLAGVTVESGHLKNWSKPRPSCLIIKEGLFSAAGVFVLTTVFLGFGLYLTALGALRMSRELENVAREVHQIPRAPQMLARENPTTRESLVSVFPTPFNKSYNFV
ncbi:uncharacterized protein LOC133294443 [Gastrolobium bilobum]|uniref:uncharacterized protein LOC133294443 n=1 Tax=Gastrolobium bilobum TaxID=150636 RepID=UPI002AB0429F|nr:uncharacterized protein LOC133294443 [Gastrolobium bilobum]